MLNKRCFWGLIFLFAYTIVSVACTAELVGDTDLQNSVMETGTAAEEPDASSQSAALSTLPAQESDAGSETTGTGQSKGLTENQTPSPENAKSPSAEGGVDDVIDVTPYAEDELAQQPEGQSEPGAAGQNDEPQTSEPGDGENQNEDMSQMIDFRNDEYGFALVYPSDFVVLNTGFLEILPLAIPETATFAFMNPDSAASEAIEYEIPDFTIRVYSANGNASLEEWLRSTGFLEGMSDPEPFQTAHISGLKVCQSTMMTPGCSFFVQGAGWNYQIIPATFYGEEVFQSFMLQP